MNNLTDLLTRWPTNQPANSLQNATESQVMNESGETFRQSEKKFLWELPVSFISVIAAHTQTKHTHTHTEVQTAMLIVYRLFVY